MCVCVRVCVCLCVYLEYCSHHLHNCFIMVQVLMWLKLEMLELDLLVSGTVVDVEVGCVAMLLC